MFYDFMMDFAYKMMNFEDGRADFVRFWTLVATEVGTHVYKKRIVF